MATKRGNGEGTIGQGTDGRWVARLTLGNGKRKALYGRTRAEVAAKLARTIRERDTGVLASDDRITVGAYLDHWLNSEARQTVRDSTWRGYEVHVRVHLMPALGKIRLTQLSPRDVERMQAGLLDSGHSAATVQRVRSTLRRALGRAVKQGTLTRNVVTLVDPPRLVREPVRALSADAARALLSAFAGHTLEAPVRIALATGLRQGELLGLRWTDVDLGEATLTVRWALQRIRGELVLVEPKTPTSRRTLPLQPPTVAVLHRHRAAQGRARLLAGERWQDTGHVFTTSVGAPLDGTDLTHRFQERLAAAGLARMRWHDLRHGCASLLIANGASIRYVAEYLGHSTPSQTMNVYAHVTPTALRETAALLDDVLAGGA